MCAGISWCISDSTGICIDLSVWYLLLHKSFLSQVENTLLHSPPFCSKVSSDQLPHLRTVVLIWLFQILIHFRVPFNRLPDQLIVPSYAGCVGDIKHFRNLHPFFAVLSQSEKDLVFIFVPVALRSSRMGRSRLSSVSLYFGTFVFFSFPHV